MKIFVPTPAEAGRVAEVPVGTDPQGDLYDLRRLWRLYYSPRDENKKWFREEAAARAASDAATRKRIASLEKQITKLKGFLGEAGNEQGEN